MWANPLLSDLLRFFGVSGEISRRRKAKPSQQISGCGNGDDSAERLPSFF